MRIYYSLYVKEDDGTWNPIIWRACGKLHIKICAAMLKSDGIETHIKEETF